MHFEIVPLLLVFYFVYDFLYFLMMDGRQPSKQTNCEHF